MLKRILLLFCISLLVNEISAQADSLKEYVGSYAFPADSPVPEVEITLTDGVLYANSVAGSSTLVRQEKDLFTVVEFNGTALFKRDDAGKIIGIHIEAGGYILDGTKKSAGFRLIPVAVLRLPDPQFLFSIK